MFRSAFPLDDGGNSLLSHVTEDVETYGAQLIATMIGENDMAVARTAAQYRVDLAGPHARYRRRALNWSGRRRCRTDRTRRHAVCPKPHPYIVPQFTLGAWYTVDATLAD